MMKHKKYIIDSKPPTLDNLSFPKTNFAKIGMFNAANASKKFSRSPSKKTINFRVDGTINKFGSIKENWCYEIPLEFFIKET